MPIVIRLD